MKFNELRKKYPKFIYKGYDIRYDDDIIIEYDFRILGLNNGHFKPLWKIPYSSKKIDERVLKRLAFSLGMIEAISYWKLTCSPIFIIEIEGLLAGEKDFYEKLFKKGLGEFFYVNNILPPQDIIEFQYNSSSYEMKAPKREKNNKVLVPIGGGKDSITSLEILKDFERVGFIINPRGATIKTMEQAGLKETLILKRTLDKNMLKLNREGFLNGHTPFSALVASAALISAYFNDINYIALSNENSANESTVLGVDINHQYSKSEEFERDFIEYEKTYLGTGIKYFSLLRPLNELRIVEIFARLKDYHTIFKSCNVGSKEDRWCGECAKCLFVYIMLGNFLSREELFNIFGKDLFEDEFLTPILRELTGMEETKPFECVGTVDEVNASLKNIIDNYKGTLPVLLREYKSWNIESKVSLENLINYYDENHHIPLQFEEVLKKYLEQLNERRD